CHERDGRQTFDHVPSPWILVCTAPMTVQPSCGGARRAVKEKQRSCYPRRNGKGPPGGGPSAPSSASAQEAEVAGEPGEIRRAEPRARVPDVAGRARVEQVVVRGAGRVERGERRVPQLRQPVDD